MENYHDSQFNRGRCIYQSKRKPVLTEDESETYPENIIAEKERQNIPIHNAEGDNEEAAKKETAQNKTHGND